ncbi:Transposase and inactivated derivatives, IS30 family [Microlunatus soli]|uniref:Transposase and inactivated derivatives, IS30 family n=2 Tax=Microlunatus soli TaxID=630515 RepID=A0A1H1SG44_9ACTN|nr:Transposase and inactivated derivatives, IS30 family [Microlunatus soli]
MVMFSVRMVPEIHQGFWEAMANGAFFTSAVIEAGVDRRTGSRWLARCGGIRPRRGRNLKGRCLTFVEREDIAVRHGRGEGIRQIAAALERSPATISRELRRNAEPDGRYRASSAHARAYQRASRPKPAKLATNPRLRDRVQADLKKKYSPEQIVGRLRVEFGDDPQMRVSPESIYQSVYVPSRGGLEQQVSRCLRTGRALRKPCRKAGQRKNRIPNMINISKRPIDANDRAVPGHLEGDLIIGRRNASAVGTLVDRCTNYTILVHLPDGYRPEHLQKALTRKLHQLPVALRHSLTWDQGPEMTDWEQVKAATGIDIYFADPHTPWQRPVNENTNGLLRQYLPKGSDLSVHSEADLNAIAAELNDRPRKRLGYRKPIEEIGPLLLR